MVNRRLDPTRMLSLIHKHARKHDLEVKPLKRLGKGSHNTYALVRADGTEAARFGLTGHPRDLSWKLMHQLEDGLAPVFGEKWTEKR